MDNQFFAGLRLKLQGHLKIYEYDDHIGYKNNTPARVLLDKRNSIHKDNVSILIVKALTNRPLNRISYMAFGNGGTTLGSTGVVTLKSTNDTGPGRDLYNPVFFQMVDDRIGALDGNSMSTRHINGSLFSDMEFRCLVNQTQPFGQLSSPSLSNINLSAQQFKFDEIGLKLEDGTLITHVIFVPILKTASTLLEIIYTIRVAITPEHLQFADVLEPTTAGETTVPQADQSASLSEPSSGADAITATVT